MDSGIAACCFADCLQSSTVLHVRLSSRSGLRSLRLASAYKLEKQEYRGISYSYAQIQVLEYLPENEERQENMSAVASPLGRALYQDDSQEILRWHFSPMFRELAQVPLEERSHLRDALFAAMNGSRYWQQLAGGEAPAGEE